MKYENFKQYENAIGEKYKDLFLFAKVLTLHNSYWLMRKYECQRRILKNYVGGIKRKINSMYRDVMYSTVNDVTDEHRRKLLCSLMVDLYEVQQMIEDAKKTDSDISSDEIKNSINAEEALAIKEGGGSHE